VEKGKFPPQTHQLPVRTAAPGTLQTNFKVDATAAHLGSSTTVPGKGAFANNAVTEHLLLFLDPVLVKIARPAIMPVPSTTQLYSALLKWSLIMKMHSIVRMESLSSNQIFGTMG
jgi:hypothetical protein